MFNTIEDIKAANFRAGGHFFDRDLMRFLRSRILDEVIQGCYFVTSEQFSSDSAPRYTIRKIDENGSIRTVAGFRQFGAARAAKRFARKLIT